MRRVDWIVVPVATALVGAALAVAASARLEIVVAALGAVAAAALVVVGRPMWVLAVPFLIVQVLGAGFRPPGLPAGLAQVSFALVLGTIAWRAPSRIARLTGPLDRGIAAFGLVLVAASLIGLVGGADLRGIKEDGGQFVLLAASYVAARLFVRTRRDLEGFLGLLALGSTMAALKLGYLLVTGVEITWDGTWQAVRWIEQGSYRLILRGADVFFIACPLVALARWLSGERPGVLAVLASAGGVAAVLIGGTRSNYTGLALGALLVVIASLATHRAAARRAVAFASLGGAALLIVLIASPSLQARAAALVGVAQQRGWTITWRVLEAQGMLGEIATMAGLGNGMGSTYFYWDMNLETVARTPWGHNGYLLLLLKSGIVGLLVFLATVGGGLRTAARLVSQHHRWSSLLTGLAASVVAVLALSVSVNKIFDQSGSMLLGFALAVFQTASETDDLA